MTYRNLGEMYAANDAVAEKMDRVVRGLSAAQTRFHSSENAWSIGQVVEHVSLIEGQLVSLIVTLLKRTEDAGKIRSATAPFEISVESQRERSLREKYVTREKYIPTGKPTAEESLNSLQRTRAQLQSLRPRLELIDCSFASFPHWVFGTLTLGQWVAFIGLHAERHTGQIQSIMATPGFPKE